MRAVVAFLLVAACLMAQPAPVRVWERTLRLPTSEEGPPDPNPPFDFYATSRYNYPYTLRENLTGNHPIVAYYRAYCRERLGKPDKSDYAAVSKLSTQYVFPWSPQTLTVLRTAVEANPDDATAHFLLGSFYLSRGDAKQAVAEWQTARRLNPKIPVLHANLGRALLGLEGNAPEALAVFREGLSADPMNVELYNGMVRALSFTSAPASERVAAIEKYPDPARMPSPLVYELALNLAEAGEFNRAEELFKDRFFPREEGGTNVRQVWLEVRLERTLDYAGAGKCAEAASVGASLPAEVPGLSITRDGLAEFLRSPRYDYLLGSLDKRCGKPEQAVERFRRAAQGTRAADLYWANLAARELPDYDQGAWFAKLRNALAAIEAHGEPGSLSFYIQGTLSRQIGSGRADEFFRLAFDQPDVHMAHHLSRIALAAK